MSKRKEDIAKVAESETVVDFIENMTEVMTEAEEEIIERPYELKKLDNGDLWPVVRILAKILPDNLKDAFIQVVTGEKTLKDIGGMVACDMIVMITKNIHMAQKEVDEFCAKKIGKSIEELNEMEFGTTLLIIYDLFGEGKNASFFKVVSKLL